MSIKVSDEIAYPFPNFNGCTIEVWEWINNFIPHFYNECNYLSMSFGTKSLTEQILNHCQLDLLEQISVKYESQYKDFLSTNPN